MQPKSLTLLLVDDDPDDMELIRTAFEFVDTKLYLHEVNDGIEALDHLEKLSEEEFPCLIVLDFNMPRMNGLEVLQQLKTNDRYNSIPRVILTTSSDTSLKEACLANSADKFLVKPSSYPELVKLAATLMDWCTSGVRQ